jgi:hypothetical protein
MPITRAYDQSKDPRWKSDEETSEGVCFGLSVWWIIKNAQGEDYWTWMLGEGPQVQEIKDTFLQQSSGSKFSNQNRFEVAQGIIKGYLPNLQVPKGEQVPDQTIAFKNGYYYVSLEGLYPGATERSAHGIAAYFSDTPPCKYFDPNLGEGQVSKQEEMLPELNNIVKHYDIKGLSISKVRFVMRGSN